MAATGMTCGICGVVFHGRSDAIYCSPACRQKAHRTRTAERTAAHDLGFLRKPRPVRVITKPDVAGTIQRARREVQRAQELCCTATGYLQDQPPTPGTGGRAP